MNEKYELMLITLADLEEGTKDALLADLQAVVPKFNGEIDALVDWRKRRLAYEINKLTEGHYYLLYFKAEKTIVPELEHFFRVSDQVMRYMVVRLDESDYAAAVEKAAAEAARQSEQSVQAKDEAKDEASEAQPIEELEVSESSSSSVPEESPEAAE